MGNYYCLLAGLPEISFDDTKCQYNTLSLKEEMQELLSKKDYDLIKLFFARYDNQNILKVEEGKEEQIDKRGNLTADEIKEAIQLLTESDTIEHIDAPVWFSSYIEQINESSSLSDHTSREQLLSTLMEKTLAGSKNKFLRNWSEFQMNITNILTAITCRKHNLPIKEHIVGGNEIAELLCNSITKDFGIAPIFPWLNTVLKISEIEDLHNREMAIDKLKWDFIEEEVQFNDFSIEKVLAYLIQLDILERWLQLSKESGLDIFEKFVATLKGSFIFEEDFALPKSFR